MKSSWRMESEATSRAPMAEGGGSSTGGTAAPRVTISQTVSSASPNMTGMSRAGPVPRTRPCRRAAESSSTKSQAKAQAARSANQKWPGMVPLSGRERISAAAPSRQSAPSIHRLSGRAKRKSVSAPRARNSVTSGASPLRASPKPSPASASPAPRMASAVCSLERERSVMPSLPCAG